MLTRCFGIYVFAFFALPTIFVPFYDTMQNLPPAGADTVIQKHFDEYAPALHIYSPSKLFFFLAEHLAFMARGRKLLSIVVVVP